MAESGASPLPPSTSPLSPRSPHSSALSRAEQFVWLTARVLEQRRFAYHFLNGGADPVETALAAYLNEDDGYGHALEPDLRGPVSQPLHTGHALRVLDSIGRCGGQRVERVCRYLSSVSTPEGALPAIHPSQRGYPSAPFVKSHPYEVEAAVVFLDNAPDRPRAEAAADRLGRMVREQRLAVLDPDQLDSFPVAPGYAPGEHHFPYDYAKVPESLARAWFTDEEMERSLDFLEREQQGDGGWPIRWRQWAPGTALESRPIVTIEALLTLRAYGRTIV
jgi:hypothetical protein